MNLDLQDALSGLPQISDADCLSSDEEKIKMHLKEWQDAIKNSEFPLSVQLVEEFTRFGLLHVFYNDMKNGNNVNLKSI